MFDKNQNADSSPDGKIGFTTKDSRAEKPTITYPPRGAPNVVVVMLDDVGFGAADTFGGPIAMTTLAGLAASGLRYNQFHTAALSSPTRAALITGRNHHSAHMGGNSEVATGFPGYDSAIPKSTATVAEVLRQRGYNTAWFGKGHVTPMWETSPAGPFDRWPTGLGFERFYGFIGGETSQWQPALYDQTTPIAPYKGRKNYHLTEDLADQCIAWMHNQKASAPDKPFFVYFAPGAGHSPHHVPKEWIDKFKGQFNEGWDELRKQTFHRQLEQRVIPADTKLTARPEQIPAWANYPPRYRPVAARLMETYAGFLAHTDAQIGRVVSSIKEIGVWDNTLFIYIVGDNGASGEGTVHGAWSSPSFQNGMPEDPEFLLAHMDDFGSPRCENHYNAGWAWGLDTPFRWMKQVASHFGGTRNGLVISWPNGIKARGEQRSQFHHIIDIAPTVLEAARIEAPGVVNGVEQKPMEGVSMLYTFANKDATSRHCTQYFEILSAIAASITTAGSRQGRFHGRLPWERAQSIPFGPKEKLGALQHRPGLQSERKHREQDARQAQGATGALRHRGARKYGVYSIG